MKVVAFAAQGYASVENVGSVELASKKGRVFVIRIDFLKVTLVNVWDQRRFHLLLLDFLPVCVLEPRVSHDFTDRLKPDLRVLLKHVLE